MSQTIGIALKPGLKIQDGQTYHSAFVTLDKLHLLIK